MASVSSSFHSLSSSHSIAPNSIGKVKKEVDRFSTASCARTRNHPWPISAVCTATAAPETENIGSGPALASATASFYEVLGVQAGATCQEIKAAYRRLVRVVHPDVAGNGQREDNAALADQFIRVHEAYSTLSDPERRADYDRDLFIRRRLMMKGSPFNGAATTARSGAAPLTSSGFPRRTRRTWETDQCW